VLKLVESYLEEGEETLWNGQSLPLPALVKNETGNRYLIVLDRTIPVTVWQAASASGAERVYRPNGQWIDADDVTTYGDVSPSDGLWLIHEFVWHLPVHDGEKVAEDRSEGREEAPSWRDKADEDLTVADFDQMRAAGVPVEPIGPPEPTFVHLHAHSEYSALDGLAFVKEMVAVAKEQGHKALAVTDHGVVVGHPELDKLCTEAGIKPIFGMEAYLVEDRFSRENLDYYHITLWAMTDQGLLNLWAISTEGYKDGLHGKPRVDWDTLSRLNEGVIVGSGCLRGPLSHEVKNKNVMQALHNSKRLTDIFGDRYYIEIHTNQLEEQIKVNHWLARHAKEFNIPMIAAVDSHYATKDQYDDHKVWLAMQTAKDVSQETTLFGGGQDYHMASEEEVFANLRYLGPETAFDAMLNTVALADRCNAKISKRVGMPRYHGGPDAEQKDTDLMLDLCISAWTERVGGKGNEAEYLARFERESQLLIKKGFPGYFLMNADLVRYAKSHGVLVGPGRGSGAGSLVAYLLGITEVDPVENDLLFERFMTEGRTALPDFDIDYPSSKKQFMIDYAVSRRGRITSPQ
jgi:DNA polymerase-3 subunit alpha